MPLLEALKKNIGTKGTIVTFNQTFEINCLKQLAEAFPKHKKWIDNTISRIVDLIIPFRNFDYYNPQQQGKCSIKQILPAITGKSYKELNSSGGGIASASYFESIFGNVENKEQIRKDLLQYCKLDTEGMVCIVKELHKLVN